MFNNYNPYLNFAPGRNTMINPARNHVKINWKNFLNGTQKALNIVNQAIPLIYQIKPIYNNAKTIFRVMGSIKDDNDTNVNAPSSYSKGTIKSENIASGRENTKVTNNESPTFFL